MNKIQKTGIVVSVMSLAIIISFLTIYDGTKDITRLMRLSRNSTIPEHIFFLVYIGIPFLVGTVIAGITIYILFKDNSEVSNIKKLNRFGVKEYWLKNRERYIRMNSELAAPELNAIYKIAFNKVFLRQPEENNLNATAREIDLIDELFNNNENQ